LSWDSRSRRVEVRWRFWAISGWRGVVDAGREGCVVKGLVRRAD
jgi:hypothetical protein